MMPQPRHWGVFPCLNYYTLLCSLGIISHTLGCMRFLEYMGFVLAVFPLKYGFIIVQDSILGLHYLDIVHTESSWSNSITLHSTPSPPSPLPPTPTPQSHHVVVHTHKPSDTPQVFSASCFLTESKVTMHSIDDLICRLQVKGNRGKLPHMQVISTMYAYLN